MKLAILEDRPWIMMKMLKKIRTIIPTDEISLIYYVASLEKTNELEHDIVLRCNEMNIKLIKISENEFESEMNKLYEDEERIFFFDLVLDDNSDFFEDRINVKFAKNKIQDNRIWFYTTSGNYNINKIISLFGDQYIPVIDYDAKEEALIFQEDSLRDILQKQ